MGNVPDAIEWLEDGSVTCWFRSRRVAVKPEGEATMCLGIPGRVVEFVDVDNDLAKVEVSGVRRTINVALLKDENLQPGEWVLIHVGFALSKIDESEAQLALDALERVGQAYIDEITAVVESRIEPAVT
jgi:hydrogenase expression/formation protein HypC